MCCSLDPLKKSMNDLCELDTYKFSAWSRASIEDLSTAFGRDDFMQIRFHHT